MTNMLNIAVVTSVWGVAGAYYLVTGEPLNEGWWGYLAGTTLVALANLWCARPYKDDKA